MRLIGYCPNSIVISLAIQGILGCSFGRCLVWNHVQAQSSSQAANERQPAPIGYADSLTDWMREPDLHREDCFERSINRFAAVIHAG